MKASKLSEESQAGLRRYSKAVHGDELLIDALASTTTEWAWFAYQLRVAPDKVEWFPKGKWAVIQLIELELMQEARTFLRSVGVEPA